MRIGKKIKKIRMEQGFTQKQLGILAGVRSATICDLENGKHSSRINTLEAIAKSLGYSVEFLKK